MATVDASRKAANAVRELADSFRGLGGAAGGPAIPATSEALADAIRRGQSPELVAALKRALGLR